MEDKPIGDKSLSGTMMQLDSTLISGDSSYSLLNQQRSMLNENPLESFNLNFASSPSNLSPSIENTYLQPNSLQKV